MKPQHVIIALLILFLIAGCSGQAKSPTLAPVATTATIPSENPTLVSGAGYPAPVAGSGYPAANQPNSPASVPSVAPPAGPTQTPDPSLTPLYVSGVVHTSDGMEKISVTNISKNPIDLTGVVLIRLDTDEKIYLGQGKQLDPGKSVDVYNGPGQIDPAKGLKWTDKPMLTKDYDEVILIDKASRVISGWVYYEYMK
jgi:hypothetical protein